MRPRVLVVGAILLAAVSAAAGWLAFGVPVLTFALGAIGGAAPFLWLRHSRIRNQRHRRTLWPDVCDHLIAGVRAGQSLPDAVGALALTAPQTLRPSFAAFARDLAASGQFDPSVDALKTRLADPIADRILETLRMARQVGGTELTTVLRGLSAGVRAESTLRGEVEARQSWIRGAAVLGVVAPWIILALLSLRPEGARAYSSSEGALLVGVGALVSVIAYVVMVRIGRLPQPRRWFA